MHVTSLILSFKIKANLLEKYFCSISVHASTSIFSYWKKNSKGEKYILHVQMRIQHLIETINLFIC